MVSSDAMVVAGGAIAVVVVSLTVFNKFSLAVVQGSSGLPNDGRLVKDGTALLNDCGALVCDERSRWPCC